jgi:hypothetical protein
VLKLTLQYGLLKMTLTVPVVAVLGCLLMLL